tara:strand:- start:854 stop:1255 length:402 start_codon:yes stop_codon:yes gene_type:complete
MHNELIQVLFLAALSDGQLHEEEKQLIAQYTKFYPIFKNVSSDDIKDQLKILSTKINSGIPAKYIITEIKNKLNQEELKTAYALAVELCCANFKLVPPENDFIGMLEEVWEINKTNQDIVKKSAYLRYATKFN